MRNLAGLKVLVTGGAGFLGSFVAPQLRAERAQVVIARRREHDLTSQVDVERLFQQDSPDVVIHLAAEVGGIGANRVNPGRYFYANAMMGLNLIEASRRHGVDKFVQVGTVCAYPKFCPVPFHESDLWNGYPEETNAPYGVAKKSLAVMIEAYRQQYDFNGIFLVPANLYGPGDNFDPETSHVIPALVRKFTEATESGSSSVQVWGSGSASREFLFVEDAARAIVLATASFDSSDPVNIGTGHEVSIKDLVDLIVDLTGFQGEIVWDASKPDGQPRRRLDVSRAREAFGFEATTELEDGLKRTIQWFREHRALISE